MNREPSEYSIPELLEAIAAVDGNRFPENKLALEKELEARKESGEYDRYRQQALEAGQRQLEKKAAFAKKMQKVIAVYLIVAAVYGLVMVFAGVFSPALPGGLLALFVVFSATSLAGGAGLLLAKPWAYWVSVAVLGIQIIEIQAMGIAFGVLSLAGVYFYIAAGGTVGITATFSPSIVLDVGSNGPFLFGINLLAIVFIAYLFSARDDSTGP
ncbi:MAG: hypothetical protein KJO82_15600 [Gammaproteobacteria bacterium]|nr:hypothetical protein [Gammaproteobacteria bacterium]